MLLDTYRECIKMDVNACMYEIMYIQHFTPYRKGTKNYSESTVYGMKQARPYIYIYIHTQHTTYIVYYYRTRGKMFK